jgi:hypothetical protein
VCYTADGCIACSQSHKDGTAPYNTVEKACYTARHRPVCRIWCYYYFVNFVVYSFLTSSTLQPYFPERPEQSYSPVCKHPLSRKPVPRHYPELATYLAPFAPLFRRSTSRASVERYLTGLLTDLPRKNCDTIAAAVAGTSTERLQHLLTDATWDPQGLDQHRVRALVTQSPPQGLLVLDDTGLPKQGRSSVGVARQYLGPSARSPIARLLSARTTLRMSRRAAPPCIGP